MFFCLFCVQFTWSNHIGFSLVRCFAFLVNNWILQSFIDQRKNLSENDHDNYNVLSFGDLYHRTTSDKQLAERNIKEFHVAHSSNSSVFFPSMCNPGFWTSKRYLRLLFDKPICKAFEVLFDNMHFSLELENSSCFL